MVIFYSIVTECQYWLDESNGLLTSPYFDFDLPVQYYYNNLNCTWILKAEQGFYVNFEIDAHHFKVKTEMNRYYRW